MTQKATVRRTLEAHPEGVRSDYFFALHIPRAAARIQELKDEGVPIDTKREGKYVRWTLAGIGADAERSAGDREAAERAPGLCGRTRRQMVSVDSGERGLAGVEVGAGGPAHTNVETGPCGPTSVPSPVPSMFDYDADWAA